MPAVPLVRTVVPVLHATALNYVYVRSAWVSHYKEIHNEALDSFHAGWICRVIKCRRRLENHSSYRSTVQVREQ